MKRELLSIAMATGLIAACGGEPEVADPYAELGEDTLWVRFEANPNLEPGQCNPNIQYALRTDEEFILINANYEVVDQSITGTGASLNNEDGSGIALTTSELNMFDPYPLPCSELTVRVMDLTCRTETDVDSTPCPNPQFEGTEMFASFRGLPDY